MWEWEHTTARTVELGPMQGQAQAPQSLECNWGTCGILCLGPDQLDLSHTLMTRTPKEIDQIRLQLEMKMNRTSPRSRIQEQQVAGDRFQKGYVEWTGEGVTLVPHDGWKKKM